MATVSGASGGMGAKAASESQALFSALTMVEYLTEL